MDITGNKYLVDFGMAKAVLHFQNNTVMNFIITEKEGKQVSIAETVGINCTELRPGLLMVTWKEKSGTTVTQVQDYNNETVYSNWTSADGVFTNLRGSLSRYLPLTVQTVVKASPADCWKRWTDPADILLFNNPFNDWHTAKVETDLKQGGRFFYRMEAKDGSSGFDFAGEYDTVIANERIEYTGDDGRKTINIFAQDAAGTIITEIFEPDTTTPVEVQKAFCQTILDNFKKYMETGN